MTLLRCLRGITLLILACTLALGAYVLRHPELRSGFASDELPEFGALGSYSFTDSAGTAISDRDLNGKVCVFACFFTCCTQSCPALSGSMARLQSELAGLRDLRLVSLSVNPEMDTPEKLAAYAQAFGAQPGRWLFVTGPRAEVDAFAMGRLKVAVEENKGADASPGNKFLHSNLLILVDRGGQIRGFFSGTDADAVEQLKVAARKLHG